MSTLPDAADHRQPDYPIEPLLYRRWSPRALSGEPITEKEMLTLFEAARWAPSTYNEQEWRFLYALRDTPHWLIFFDLLMEANQTWCENAAMLVVIVSHKVFEKNGKPNPVHLFDCGNAFENIALQGTAMGLVVHGMAGFDYERARTILKVPDDYDIAAMFAVGRPGDPDKLTEKLRAQETPSGRRPAAQSIREGPFTP
jgi:nitroreductase